MEIVAIFETQDHQFAGGTPLTSAVERFLGLWNVN